MGYTFESLLHSQQELHGRVARIVDNLKKLGQKNITSGAVKARLTCLDSYWEKFETQHEILTTEFASQLVQHEYLRKDFQAIMEDTYYLQKSTLLDWDAAPEIRPEPVATPRSFLPRIELPTFGGRYEEWVAFKDLFTSIIQKDQHLTNVEKLHYLKTSLKGEAKTLVSDLQNTGDNYERAWEHLENRYANKRRLVRTSLSKLVSLQRMKSESADELKRIFQVMTTTISSLESIGRPVFKTEDLLLFIIVELFDSSTRREWEGTIDNSTDLPTYAQLKAFLERRIHIIEALQPSRSGNAPKPAERTATRSFATLQHTKKRESCLSCKKDHFVMFCEEYRKKNPQQRPQLIQQSNHCTNCLGSHALANCPSVRVCTICSAKHHSSLHDVFTPAGTSSSTLLAQPSGTGQLSVLLATARVNVLDRFGNPQQARALIDQGSETSLITERLAQRLQLPRSKAPIDVCGVGGVCTGTAKGRVQLSVTATQTNANLTTPALVLPKATLYAQAPRIFRRNWNHIRGLKLADPYFEDNNQIDLLLGVDAYAAIIRRGLRTGRKHQPVAQATSFGWILSGITGRGNPTPQAQNNLCSLADPLPALVQRFWIQEEGPRVPQPLTPDEQECEEHFASTHTRAPDGRYCVRLPLKGELPDLAYTRNTAMRVLAHNERRFSQHSELREAYREFLQTYEGMGHMKPAKDTTGSQICYLPHHGVWRHSSTTTRLRVVFNGSCRSTQGYSLNDYLHAGQNLLPALSDILLKWRTHKWVIAADIEKMYRQIMVHPDDRNLQRILWRTTPSQPIQEYRLSTVTYGLACAPFLAIRTLHQLAVDEGSRFPRAKQVLLRDVYVDDVLSGADTIAELKQLQEETRDLCMAGGFPLKKWVTNAKELERQIPIDDRNTTTHKTLSEAEDGNLTLGLLWNRQTDSFSFSIKPSSHDQVTKRSLLAQAAQLFDPLGWLTPVSTKAKIAIQSTWLLNLQWDEPLPHNLAQDWTQFHNEWSELPKAQISRLVPTRQTEQKKEFHGFADASERAFAAVLYLRSEDRNGSITTSLITAKSRVAPLKQVSIPRLELCAAHLLCTLVQHAKEVLDATTIPTYLWSDSTVVLGWIQGHPTRWKTYVANRVAEIQRLTSDATWGHIPGELNPADCASRGLTPKELLVHPLWWTGPSVLPSPVETASHASVDLPEARVTSMATAINEAPPAQNRVLERASSYVRLIRVTAWCKRWLSKTNKEPTLTSEEMQAAEFHLIKQTQAEAFEKELQQLRHSETLPAKSQISSLTPFIDQDEILRVGGRLKHSLLAWDEKHPILLPADSKFTRLLIEAVHKRCLHGGVQLTLSHLRQRFWIPRARALIKKCIHQCTPCVRWRAAPAQQRMAELPPSRVRPSRPFQHTGVDYAGPVMLRTARGRGHKANKAFLVIFVCLVTKAVHLDVASDYSAKAFLAALQRFIARRGMCSAIYSDRGTTFTGADSELRRLFADQSRQATLILDYAAAKGIKWCFNPPAAPHFGGIWEAAVKSTKHHLRRVIGEATLTYEEMATLLAQVEACLNSRPLCRLTDDPNDNSALTPGHFLVGSALTAIPEPSLLSIDPSRLSRWQLISQMREAFWKRWAQEYIQSLLPRTKWRDTSADLQIGQLCLIRDEATPPARWPLAKIIELHPGSDGHIRVVTLKTATTKLTRPVVKLVKLPVTADDNQQSDHHVHGEAGGMSETCA